MGTLTLPATGLVYLDAGPLIYSVEKHPVYWPLLKPIWQAASGTAIEIVSSELVLLECLVRPLKIGDAALVTAYEQLFHQKHTRLFPISRTVLHEAAKLRATTKLKTPDALHAATALLEGCALFVTNDAGFRGSLALPFVIVDDLLKP